MSYKSKISHNKSKIFHSWGQKTATTPIFEVKFLIFEVKFLIVEGRNPLIFLSLRDALK